MPWGYSGVYIIIRRRNTIVLLQKIRPCKMKFVLYPNINNLRNTNVTLLTVHVIFLNTRGFCTAISMAAVILYQGNFKMNHRRTLQFDNFNTCVNFMREKIQVVVSSSTALWNWLGRRVNTKVTVTPSSLVEMYGVAKQKCIIINCNNRTIYPNDSNKYMVWKWRLSEHHENITINTLYRQETATKTLQTPLCGQVPYDVNISASSDTESWHWQPQRFDVPMR